MITSTGSRCARSDIVKNTVAAAMHVDDLPVLIHGSVRVAPAAPHRVVGFEVILGAYSPLSIAAMTAVWLAGLSSAMEPSER